MGRRDKEVEFKSYGLYSDVAKRTEYTVDQVSTVYDWFLRQSLKEIKFEDTLQAEFKNLGKFKFNPKKGLNYLTKYCNDIERSIEYYNKYKDEQTEERQFKINRAYIVMTKRHEILKPTIESFKNRLEKFYLEGGIKEDQYNFHKTRLLKLESKTNNLYESIQRISESRKEGS
jgi:hypothetical protein